MKYSLIWLKRQRGKLEKQNCDDKQCLANLLHSTLFGFTYILKLIIS